LCGGNPTCGPLPLAAALGLTGFFFPLRQSMLGVLGQPAIREQGLQGNRVARGDSRGQKARQGDVVGKRPLPLPAGLG
jgi:hypothetical protein